MARSAILRAPEGSTRRVEEIPHYNLAILGAGCAGMSLAYRLALHEYAGSVVIIDPRTDFLREQRWCSWGPAEPEIERFISHRWPKFVVRCGGRVSLHDAIETPYLQVYAPDFYAGILECLSGIPKVRLLTGTSVADVKANDDKWTVATSVGNIDAGIVVDARNLVIGPPDQSPDSSVWLWQSFAGLKVEFDTPQFNPEEAVFMDFDVPGASGGSFMYTLPFTDKSALVESTLISRKALDTESHILRVLQHIENRNGAPYLVTCREVGNIPMTNHPFSFQRAPGWYTIGVAGGSAKPSTGYAFSRIQEETKRLADDIVHDRPPKKQRTLADRRRSWLDSVFLEAVDQNEILFRTLLVKMFEELPTSLLIRFLSEQSTVVDDLKVMRTIGNRELVQAATRHLLKWKQPLRPPRSHF